MSERETRREHRRRMIRKHRWQRCPVCRSLVDAVKTAEDARMPFIDENGHYWTIEACSSECAAKRAITDPRFLDLSTMTDTQLRTAMDDDIQIPPKYRARRMDAFVAEIARRGWPGWPSVEDLPKEGEPI